MDARELETYEYQLSQVKLTLQRDPTNTEMLNLEEELTNLISLTKEFLAAQAPPKAAPKHAPANKGASESPATPVAGPSKPKEGGGKDKEKAVVAVEEVPLNAGDQCMAKYKTDGKFYPARITTVSGSSDTKIYTVVFKGYDTTELVSSSEIKSLTETKKRALEINEADAEKDKKRKKNEKKTETKAVKAAEQLEKQKSWQSFAKKGAKKGVHIPGIAGGSMFASPDNPYGKVGVTGSGKGMTQFGNKQRHKFE